MLRAIGYLTGILSPQGSDHNIKDRKGGKPGSESGALAGARIQGLVKVVLSISNALATRFRNEVAAEPLSSVDRVKEKLNERYHGYKFADAVCP
jgi:hypothetical protein